MRKFLSTILSLLLMCSLYAQQRNITGTVIDDKGNPVPFATITVKGSRQGISADQNGSFTINVKNGDILVISSQGFSANEITVGESSRVIATLGSSTSSNLTEVVVSTGYNTRRTQRSTVSNAQVVNAESLNTIRQTNLNNALAGKVAGVQVRSQSAAALGRDANIRLRGEASLGGSNVLYIVDGTPVNAVDINPDDIEDLSVLNGPTGAAIYGPQAANGAIVINTKRAKKNQPGVGIEINTGVQSDKIYILPRHQNSYAGGEGDFIQFQWKDGMPEEWKTLDGKFYHDYTDDASWGPRIAGQEYIPWYAWYPGTQYTGKTARLTAQPNNIRQFYNTGKTANTNISFSKANDVFNTRVSYSNIDVRGLIPNTWLKRNTLALNGSADLGRLFSIGTNLTYVNQRQQAENDDAYSNNSSGSFSQWYHRNLDMNILREFRSYRTPVTSVSTGVLPSWNHANPNSYDPNNPDAFYRGNYHYNAFSYFDNIDYLTTRNRLFGDVNFTYKPTSDIRIRAAVRKNLVNTNTENKKNYIIETSAAQTGERALYATGQTYFDDNRYELTGTYNKKIKDFSLDYLLGTEIVKITSKSLSASTRNGLYIPDFFSLNNSLDPIAQNNNREEEKRRAIFTRANIGWRNFLFGEVTLRNDWYSTLPANDNSIFVKSFGTSLVFSDFTKDIAPWVSYGKLRASWGEVPQAIGPYNLGLGYGVGGDQWNGSFVMGTPNTIVDPNLKGSVRTTKEVGLDFRFLKSRLGLSTTLYNAETKNSPVSVQVNGASGFTQKRVNAGLITQSGLDVNLFVQPLKLRNGFDWTVNAAFNRIFDNKVVELAPGVEQITLSGGTNFSAITNPFVVHQTGQQWGMLIGGGKTYNADGKLVVNEDGSFVKSENVRFGSVLPDYTGGIQNSFSFKGFTLNVNIDFQKGGKFFSLSDMFGSYSGMTARTAVLNDKGNPIRDNVADGGGVHVVGVTPDGKPVDTYVRAQFYFHSMVDNNVFDDFIYDLTFVKMRELSLGYQIPVKKLGGVSRYVQNATLSFMARNPWLIYSQTKDFDPSEISNTYGENGQFPGTRSYGVNLRLRF